MQSRSPSDLAYLATHTKGEDFPAVLGEPRTTHAPSAPSMVDPAADGLRIDNKAPLRGKAARTAWNKIRAAEAARAQTEAYSATPGKLERGHLVLRIPNSKESSMKPRLNAYQASPETIKAVSALE